MVLGLIVINFCFQCLNETGVLNYEEKSSPRYFVSSYIYYIYIERESATWMDSQNLILSENSKEQNEAYDIIYVCKLKFYMHEICTYFTKMHINKRPPLTLSEW